MAQLVEGCACVFWLSIAYLTVTFFNRKHAMDKFDSAKMEKVFEIPKSFFGYPSASMLAQR